MYELYVHIYACIYHQLLYFSTVQRKIVHFYCLHMEEPLAPYTSKGITCICLPFCLDHCFSEGGEGDYIGREYPVIFPAGSTKESVSIPITDDDIFELDETFFLTLVIPPPAQGIGVMRGDPFMANITIINDESEFSHRVFCVPNACISPCTTT